MDHHLPFFKNSGVVEEDDYEDSRQFLCMLDAATERIFEARSESIAVESSAIDIACDTEAFRQGTSNLLQEDNELRLELNPMNTLPPAPQPSTSLCRPWKRRRRSCTPEQPFPAREINIIPAEINWPTMPLRGFKAKETFTFSVGSSVNSSLAAPITRNDGESETEDVEKSGDFSKEFYDVINRIKVSLIPSLEKWASRVQKPANEKGVGRLELRRNCNPICDQGQVNQLGMTKFQEITGNDEANSSKYAEHAKLEVIVNHSLCPDLRNLSLERNSLNGKCRVHGQTIKFSKDRVGSLRTKPRQCSKNVLYQKETDKQLRFQTRDPDVGSSSFRRPKRISSMDKSGLKASKLRDTLSEETSCTSLGYSSGTSTHQSGYPYPSSFTGSTYSSVSGEYEKVGKSSTESSTDYETSSYDSQVQYSDTSSGLGPSSGGSAERPHKWEDHQLEKCKRVGRLSKFGKKVGKLFHHHHHHHHHHHYSGRDESGWGHFGFLNPFGKMFRRRGKMDDGQRQKPEKSRKPVTKCVTKKTQDGGHFRALIGGLMRHKKHSKKTEKAKEEIGRLGSVRHKDKRGTKKKSWWPKMGRNKAKVANKGKVKLGRAMTRAKRSQFAAAKMILK